MAGQHDARLLISIGGIHAYHIHDGHETPLTPPGSGQQLSLLMVPTSSPTPPDDGFGAHEAAAAAVQHPAPLEEDFYLHLRLPPDLDLPLPATTQIFHQPPRSYLLPRWDLGPDAHAFTRLEFPAIGHGPDRVAQEEVDTFETILAQCTAFLERAPVGDVKGGAPPRYNPQDYAPGEGYVGSSTERGHGHIVLVDEENGSVVGELSEGFNLVEGTDVKPGSKKPVEIQLPNEGQPNNIAVHEVSEEYLQMARHPAYQGSTIVQNAATASRLIVSGTTYLASGMRKGTETFTQRTKPNPKPMKFSPATQERVRKLNTFTHGAVGLSAATVGQVGRIAQSVGAKMGGRGNDEAAAAKAAKKGKPPPSYKPGVLNKSLIAFSTIADGIEQGAKQLLAESSTAAATMVGHRYGAQAGQVAGSLAGGVRNVGLVYVDAAGVSRKAVLKSVAKGMIVGRMPDGNELMVGDGDGGVPPAEGALPSAKGGAAGSMVGGGGGPPGSSAASAAGSAPPPYQGSGRDGGYYPPDKRYG